MNDHSEKQLGRHFHNKIEEKKWERLEQNKIK